MRVSEITSFLEHAYGVLNEVYFESSLPPVVITVQSSPKAYGHYTTWDAWRQDEKGYREINLGAESLSRPIENTIATLIHEMTHHYCAMAGIKDTSRGGGTGGGSGTGTYHNKKFKEQAEKRGLVIGYDPRIGHSLTSPSQQLIEFIESQGWTGIDLSRTGWYGSPGGAEGGSGGDPGGGADTGKKKSNVRKYLCPSCGCSVRATKEVHIGCLDCDVPMELVEK